MPGRTPTHPLALAAGVLAGVVAACGPMAPSPLPSPPAATATTTPNGTASAVPSGGPTDAAAIYGLVAVQVEQIRHLQPTADVAPVVIDRATLTANLTADFDAANPASLVVNSQRELIALGLLPAGTSLRQAVLALQSGQVAGYYSPERNELFVVSRAGGIGPTQRLTYAHEFTHQLQDQNFDLARLDLQAPDQGDRSLGRLALVEGDAVAAQQTWILNLTSQELTQVLADALDPSGLAALNNAAPILRETSLFPYTAGLGLVQALLDKGGYAAVDAAFANPPASTEQVVHPEKYLSGEAPIVVTPAADLAKRLGSGWSEVARDTLGEEVLLVWLREGGVTPAEAAASAYGWGGDRIVLYAGPNGATALVIETAWDTDVDATEFAVAAQNAIAGLHLNAGVSHGAGTTTVAIGVGPSPFNIGPLLAALPS